MPLADGDAPRMDELTVGSKVLSSEQIFSLDSNGYLVIPDCLDGEGVDRLRSRLDEIEQEEGLSAGSARQTYWQQRLPTNAGIFQKALSVPYNVAFRTVKTVAHRWIFRFAPDFKLRLQRTIGKPSHRKTRWQSLCGEFREMLHVAAAEEHGVVRICDLINKGSVFDPCVADARVLAAVRRVIKNDFKLSSLNYRAAKPGGGLQPLHIDWEQARNPGQVEACNTLWVLDDFSKDNGATRVVPGSHLDARSPVDALADCLLPHPEERQICARAGSVIIMNGQVWHGGTMNRTDRRRRVIQGYFVGVAIKPQLDQEAFVRDETLARLSPHAKSVLGLVALK